MEEARQRDRLAYGESEHPTSGLKRRGEPCCPCVGRAARPESGFVLAATLWILAAITMAASFFAFWTAQALDMASQGNESLAGEIDMLSTRSVLMYFFATQRLVDRGLSLPGEPVPMEITSPAQGSGAEPTTSHIMVQPGLYLDDQPYFGVGLARFSIQDEGGLLKLVFPQRLAELMLRMNVPGGFVNPLIAKLLDYTDADDMIRPNGAESGSYIEAGLPPPPNRRLLTTWETRNILGWGTIPELWIEHRFPRLTTSCNIGGVLNFNTAPRILLKLFDGIDDETAERIVIARRQKPMMDSDQIHQAAGKSLGLANMEMELDIMPSIYQRLTIWAHGYPRMWEIHLKSTYADPQAHTPVFLDYALTVPLTQEQKRAVCQTSPVPLFSTPVLPGAQ